MSHSVQRRAYASKIWTGLAIFLMAFLPRVSALDVFLTLDEPLWVERSVKFFGGLLSQDWLRTSQKGHPGVTTMWTGTLGLMARYFSHAMSEGTSLSGTSLFEFLQAVPLHPVDASYLAAMRLPTVLVTSAFAVALYFYVRKLFDGRVALLSAILVALDPFYLAHSRLLHHDALVTTFMTLSVLSFIVYLRQDRSFSFLIFSGLAAGLAFLSKSTSFFLVPFMGLLIVIAFVEKCYRWSTVHWKGGGCWVARLLMWMGIAILVFVLLWPAMWVDPALAMGKIVNKARESRPLTPYTSNASPFGQLLKYPAVWLLRATPLTLAGAVAALWFLSRDFRRGSSSATDDSCQHSRGESPDRDTVLGGREERENLISLVLYIVLFTLALSTMGSKYDRYLLPAFPALEIVSAWGLLQLMDKAKSVLMGRFPSVAHRSIVHPMTGLLLALVIQAGFTMIHHPYYLTFYNPMIYNSIVSGEWLASQMLYIGWGEGLDQAARYLNQKENPADLTVAARSLRLFPPFFLGETVQWSEGEERNLISWHTADYVVRYISFGSRERAYSYFCSLEPEHVVRLNGLDYAWIYKVPDEVVSEAVPAQYPQLVQFGDSIMFLGHSLDASSVVTEGEIGITLYWQCLSPMGENYVVHLKVLNGGYHVYGQQDGMPVRDGFPTNQWEEGIVVKDERQIRLLPGSPPGLYDIEVRLYDPYSQRSLEPQSGRLALPIEIPPREPPAIEALDIEHPLKTHLDNKVKLLGYNIESSFHPGHGIHFGPVLASITTHERGLHCFHPPDWWRGKHLGAEGQPAWGRVLSHHLLDAG
ncbi:MAG: glycosyltransferase family 39 protein [Anaerolineales bacterium]|nr:MAG: glycosyltransferase family 39 protein [Anaerolineales bacterium]